MINLLPDSEKTEIQAARTNILLLRYIAMTILATVGLVVIMQSSSVIISNTRQSAETLIQTNDTEAGIYAETKQQVGELSSKLSSAQLVLDQEIQFSGILTGMAALMPAGTVINKIDLDVDTIQTPATVTVFGTSTDALLVLQAAFQTSPLFQNVEFQSIGDSDGSIPGYPVSVTMSVTFSKAGVE